MLSRRTLLQTTASGFGYLAFAALAHEQAARANPAANPLAPKAPHFPAKAKRVIFLCMEGGPSHVDTFDHKPKLTADDGKAYGRGRLAGAKLLGSLWKFQQHGNSGLWVSELFPEASWIRPEWDVSFALAASHSPRKIRKPFCARSWCDSRVGPTIMVTWVASFGTGVLRPALTSLITQQVSRNEQGVVLGLNQSLLSVAQIVGPAIAGALIEHGHLTVWALWAALILAVALVLNLRAREARQAQPA